ncbi:uncharacterized protein LOC113852077 [Abrus precatorius]|uniref:Uncharacterized protein LOC113852077 n=1 Tax=Abrus precatorius TaxID=3816 RepID=A0A8B8K470_ABRPR|nr:uncharacterized protein LOC113852077 [Abrus precatorius]
MQSDNPVITLPIYEGENYHLWAIRMEAFLDASDLWEAIEEDYEVGQLPKNPTPNQIRIMTLKSAKTIWDFLKQEDEENEKVKGMQVVNLIKEFEMQRMKELETVKEYSDRLLSIVNKVRLLGTKFPDTRIVQKILVTVFERFESTISSLENLKDLSIITLAELLYAL